MRIQAQLKQMLMKVAAIAASIASLAAGEVKLTWDASTELEVVGYTVYYGLATETATLTFDSGNSHSATITGLDAGKTYNFHVRAYSTAGIESDPSNKVSFVVPGGASTTYTLKLESYEFGFVEVSPKIPGKGGGAYAAGTPVTLTARAKQGAVFAGWIVNGVASAVNPLSLVMTENKVVKPIFKLAAQQASSESTYPEGTPLTMTIERVSGQPVITVIGEDGAWVLESSTDLANWVEVASGFTSQQIGVSGIGNAFFRVRRAL